jgi:hypothetical protein
MKTCTVPGCAESYCAVGLCKWHYDRQRRGDFTSLCGPRPTVTCEMCGIVVPRVDMRLCAPCTPIPERIDQFVNPMVCVCAEPKADPKVNHGMCSACKRKPLALIGAAA